MTDCISPAGYPPITTQLVLFSSLIFDTSFFSSLMFDIVLICRRPRQLCGCVSKSSLHPWSQSIFLSNNHQKVFVESDHTNQNIVNILSFDAAETRQQTPGGLSPWISFGSQHNLIIFLCHYLTKVIFFVHVDIVLVCT
jgi:hypothetical protein